MVEDGKEVIVLMGDDIFLVVLFEKYCFLLYFFCQNFSQVINLLIDSLCEICVMLFKICFGNLKNVLDESSSQIEIFVLDSLFVGNVEFEKMVEYFGDLVVFIDCIFVGGNVDVLCKGLEQVCIEVEDVVCLGVLYIVLIDEY